jgi:hypothetical protein
MFTVLRRLVPHRALTAIVAVGALLAPAPAAVASAGDDAREAIRITAAPLSIDPWCVASCDAFILPAPTIQAARVSLTQRAAATCCLYAPAPLYFLRSTRSPNVTARGHPPATPARRADVVLKWSAVGFVTAVLGVSALRATGAVRVGRLEFRLEPSARAPPRKETSAEGERGVRLAASPTARPRHPAWTRIRCWSS